MFSRSPRGFSMTNMRPLLVSSAPITKDSTAGFSMITRPTRCMSSLIGGNEISSTASTFTEIWPMSSVGKKPLGMNHASAPVAIRVATATARTTGRCASAQSSPRS